MSSENLSSSVKTLRKFNYSINSLIGNRWSPRSMTGEEIPDQDLMPLFEAARWAPSSYNNQPWRFIYAKRNTPEWHTFFDLLIEFNQQWTKNAAVLMVMISRNTFEHNNKPARTHSFDSGSAWMSLALEGFNRGFVVHGMEGFDYEKAKKALGIPDHYTVEAMAAIGIKAPVEKLPEEMRTREFPSERRPLEEIVMKGKFKANEADQKL
jgi:nitroreductase